MLDLLHISINICILLLIRILAIHVILAINLILVQHNAFQSVLLINIIPYSQHKDAITVFNIVVFAFQAISVLLVTQDIHGIQQQWFVKAYARLHNIIILH